MCSARTRISARSLLLIFLLAAAVGIVPALAYAVNEFPSPPPRRGTSVVQSSPTQRMYVPAAPVLRTPDLIGQSVASARTTLDKLGLRAGSQATQTTTARPPGTVIGQAPKPGTPVKPGQAIDLWIAAAPAVRDLRGDRVRPEVVVPRPRPDDVFVQPPRPPRVSVVPDLIGQPTGHARALLDAAALTLGEQRRDASERPTGTVTSQTPPAGARVKPGTAIDVTVAVPLLVAVPDVTGRSPDDARQVLARYKLGLGDRQRRPSEAATGTVVGQSPAAGAQVRPGTHVDVVIAVPILVAVPDVTGRSPDDARQVLARYKLGLGDQQRRPSEAATGTVVGQSPAAGAQVRPGTSVDVFVAVPVLIAVPDVTGRAAAEARQLLDRSRLGMGESRRRESEATVGSVLSQSPAAGTRVRLGTPVDIEVAVARPVAATPTVPLPPVRPPIAPRPDEPAPAPAPPVATPPAPTPAAQPPVAQPPVTPAPRVPTPTPEPAAPASPETAPAPQPSVTPPPRAPEPASPPSVTLPSPPPAAPTVEPTPGPPLRMHWGIAATLVLGAAAGFIYYRGRSTGGNRQPPAPSLSLDFAPHWDPGRQQIGPAGPLSDGSGLRLISRIEIGTPSLEDDRLVGAAANNGGLLR